MRCPACQEETPAGLTSCVHCGSALPMRMDEDPLTARPWTHEAETRPEPQPPADETRVEEIQPRPWEPAPWAPSAPDADDQTLIQNPGQWWDIPSAGDAENQTPVHEASPWEPSGALPWQPGTLSTEVWPDEQRPWPAEPPAVTWNPPPGHRAHSDQGNRNAVLLAIAGVIVVVAALAALGIAFWPAEKTSAHNTFSPRTAVSQPPAGPSAAATGATGTTSTAGGTGAAEQATAVNGVLDAMSNSRTEFAGAMTDAEQCANLDSAIPVIQKVVGERQSELSSAQALQVGALSSGAQLKDALTRSIQASLDADNAYLAWANANQGCSGTTPQTSDYDNGNQISTDRATPAKQEFIQLWNPIAQQTNQPSRDADHI